MADSGFISIKGARVHNLKDIDIKIPRNKLVVITGLSGSGKSSLAFDTLYAEGQRRYVESLSSYARQFLGRMSKPEVDYIKGLPPAIAIEQKVSTRNPRSTVGTSTEIYEYIKLLFARIGRTFSPVSGEEVKRHQVSDIVDYILSADDGTKGMILSSLPNENLVETVEKAKLEGFARLLVDGSVVKITDFTAEMAKNCKEVYIVVDRYVVRHDNETKNRVSDSVQTALWQGDGASCQI